MMKVSVLMSVYYKEKGKNLEEALMSIINQSIPPEEIVLIEDGPLTRELYQVIQNVKKKYANLITYQFERNVMLGRALQKGVELCHYDLVARMDSDDVAVYNRLELQMKYLEKNQEIDVIGGNVEEFDDESKEKQFKKMPISMRKILKYAKYRNPINHMTVMFRRNAVLNVGNYRHFPLLEDYDLWVRMLANGSKFSNIPCVLAYVRVDKNLYKRRGGKGYYKQYLKLRKEQKELKLVNNVEYILGVLLALIITREPTFIREIIYKKILRKNLNH